MKKKVKVTKRDIVYISLFVILFVIAIFALVFSLSDIDCNFLKFSATKFRDIISVFVSASALLITAYFVILAIDAYSSVQEIKKAKADIQNAMNDITKQKEDLGILSRDYAQYLYDGLETQIALAERLSINVRNDLVITQARMSYRYPMLNKQTRIELLRKLYDIGDSQDRDNVKLLMLSPKEDAEIKKYAEFVFVELLRKFGTL